jgi:putative hydroxymethylpyrimidine transport system substrate-binding protein
MTRLHVALAVLAALSLGACGEKKDTVAGSGPAPQPLSLMLDYFPNADHAGIYAAQGTGELRKAGIALQIKTPSDPASPLKLLAAGKVDLAISYEPEVLLARDKGLKVVAVGALVQKPLTSIIAIKGAKVKTVADLEGKTVATAGIPYQAAYLETILAKAGVDPDRVKRVDVGFNLVPALLSKKADATLGAFWNYEGVELERRKKDPTIIRMESVGVPTYNELVLVAREEDVRSRGALVRRFVGALARGHRALAKDVTTGVDPLLEANPDLQQGLQTAAVRKTLPVFFPEDKRKPFGWQDPREWEAYGQWMVDNKLLDRAPSPTSLTNEFLPGRGI